MHPIRSLFLVALMALMAACSNTTLQSITVTAPQASMAKGTSAPLTAIGFYSDGTSGNLTSLVTWQSQSPAVLSVVAGGLAQGLTAGQARVNATYKSVTGSVDLSVSAATLVSVSVSPAVAAIAKGTTQGFTASGAFSDGTTQDVTIAATWAADNAALATTQGVSQGAEVLSAAGTGSTSVSATLMGQRGVATLLISNAVLTALAITPQSVTLAKGTTQQLSVIGTFSDGTTQDLTSAASWSSDSAAIATIGGGYGVASAVAQGATSLYASIGALKASTAISVTNATLASLAVTPPAPVVAKGSTVPLAATGTFSDGTTQDLTATVAWTSAQPLVAAVSNAPGSIGQLSAAGTGTTTISAALSGKSAAATVTVTSATLTQITISASSTTLAQGTSLQLIATGTFSDGSTQDITSLVNWSSQGGSVGSVSNSSGQRGVLTGTSQGSMAVGASYQGISALQTFTVTSATLSSIAVTAAAPAMAKGTTLQFVATGTFSDSSTQDLSASVAWSSSDQTIAALGAPGLFTGVAQGSVTISAQQGGVTGTFTLSVTNATLVSIAVTPPSATIAPGATQVFVATGSYSDNTTQDISSLVTWSAGDGTVATISNAGGSHGLATSVAVGSVTIAAAFGAQGGTASLTVQKPSFDVAAGPSFVIVPPAYTCQQACALLFGGAAASWACSISASGVPAHTAWVSGYGDGEHCRNGGSGTPVADNFNGGFTLYSGTGAFSAYVRDWCHTGDSINYCFANH